MTATDADNTLRLKSYFAATVGLALEMARRELSGDALLVNARKAPPEARHKGEYEVVFAAPPSRAFTDGAPRGQLSSPGRAPAEQPRDGLEQFPRTALLRRGESLSPELFDLFTRLLDAGFAPDLAHRLVAAVRTRKVEPLPLNLGSGPTHSQDLFDELGAHLRSLFSVKAELGTGRSQRRVVALVGPPGAGKTTTLAKLAVRYGLVARRPAMLLSLDTCRIGGAEHLRSYAAILGVGFQALDTTVALGQTLAEHENKDLILIDTPGFSAANWDDALETAAYLAARPEIDTHLVLPAPFKSADLRRAAHRFSIFRPAKLLFTRLDETETSGSALSTAIYCDKPVSFLGTGQTVPEDLEPACQERLLRLALDERTRRARSAA